MSKVLYPTSAGPVPTRLLSDYYPGDSSVTLRTLSDVPPAPNLITIYMDDVFVTLLYTSVDDEHTLSGLTYVEGDDTISFRESSYAVRTLNKYDIDAIQEYLTEHGQSLVQHTGLLEGLRTDLDNHEADKSNPHDTTKAQVGLGNADNTSDVNKPVSTAQRAAIDAVQDNLDDHEANKSNPHGVTKAQVGLGNVDNTSDVNKPVSTAQRTAINTVQSNLDDHEANKSNPHSVTKAQVGLSNVNNTSDANKPVSTAQRTAIDLVQSNIDARTIDGVTFDNSISHYAVCSTAAGVAAKTITLDGFSLGVGARVIVQFTNANREANPTLNVSGTGAYPIVWKGANVDVTALDASTVYELVYTGESWAIVGNISVRTKQPTIHGFLLDNSDSNPQTRITYIGASTNLTAEERMALYTQHNRHCVVKAAQVVGLCDESDWSKFEDGTDSGVTNELNLDGNFMIRHDTLWWRVSKYTPDIGMFEITWDNPYDDTFVTAHLYNGKIMTELFTGVSEGHLADGKCRSIYSTTLRPSSIGSYSPSVQYTKNTGLAEGMTEETNTYNFTQPLTYIMKIILLTWLYGTTNFQGYVARGIVDGQTGDETKELCYGVSLTGGMTQGVPGNQAIPYEDNISAVCGGMVNLYGNAWEYLADGIFYNGKLAITVDGCTSFDITSVTTDNFDEVIPSDWHIITLPSVSTGPIRYISFDTYYPISPLDTSLSYTTYMCDNYAVRDDLVVTMNVGASHVDGAACGPYSLRLRNVVSGTVGGARLQCHGLTPIKP